MGTRGFVGFVADGVEKIAYNHWDSYPEALGVGVLTWLSGCDLDRVRLQARALRVVAQDSEPTEEDVRRLARWTNLTVGARDEKDWYCLLRETQGRPGEILEAGVLCDAGQFPRDSLFAEWGYVVDFDASVFEAYRGLQKQPHSRGRFASRETWTYGSPTTTYYPVALAVSWPLGDLPTEEEFLDALKGRVEDDDD